MTTTTVYSYSTITTSNFSYQGEYRNGMREGRGVLTFNNGDVYVGEFLMNKRQGQGRYTYKSNGTVEEGSYVDGKPHGHIRTHWPASGSLFEGEYNAGQMARGTLTAKCNQGGEEKELVISLARFEPVMDRKKGYEIFDESLVVKVGTILNGKVAFDPDYLSLRGLGEEISNMELHGNSGSD